jgi:hypothetical protein
MSAIWKMSPIPSKFFDWEAKKKKEKKKERWYNKNKAI